jgi:hypothetical protein
MLEMETFMGLRLQLLKLFHSFCSFGVFFFSSFKYVISNFWQNYCCLYFPLNFNFKKNSQKESSSCENSSPKKCWVQGDG